MWAWYLGWCSRTPRRCLHHSPLCNYRGRHLQLSSICVIMCTLYSKSVQVYTPAIITDMCYHGAKIGFMWERFLTKFWAQEVRRLLVLSESWHAWHYHQQSWSKKMLEPTHKNDIQHDLDWAWRAEPAVGLIVYLWLWGGCCSLYSNDYLDQDCFFEL